MLNQSVDGTTATNPVNCPRVRVRGSDEKEYPAKQLDSMHESVMGSAAKSKVWDHALNWRCAGLHGVAPN